MTRIAVTGATGRMGKTLIQLIQETDGVTLGVALTRSSDVSAELDRFDTLIDFSVPEMTQAAVAVCSGADKRLVIGTTGLDDNELAEIHRAAQQIPILMAPNMSVGINVSFKLIELAAQALGEDVDVEVIETHHRHKIDAPSGTAVKMGEILSRVLDRDLAQNAVYGRKGIVGERDRRTIGFSSIRGGDIIGEHTVLYAGNGERLEITHRASSRSNFAEGALRAARFLESHTHGLFDMQDVLGLKPSDSTSGTAEQGLLYNHPDGG